MIRVLIDTNIYLNFLRLSDQSLVMIDQLLKFAENDEIEILLPKQIEDEYLRGKYSVINEFSKEMKGKKMDIKLPAFLKKYKKSKDLLNALKKINIVQNDILNEYNSRILNPKSELNKKINKLFQIAIKPNEKKEIIEKGYYRTLKGNPPRKNNNSFGDAIIWETVLDGFTDEDLVIISADGDFECESENSEINEFLKTEWLKKSKKNIILYKTLGVFINKLTKKNTVKKDIIDEEESTSTSGLSMPQKIDNYFLTASGVNWENGIGLYTPTINTCGMCHATFTPNQNGLTISNFCPNCENRQLFGGCFVTDKICSVCKKTYYDYNDNYSRISLENKCDHCKNKGL